MSQQMQPAIFISHGSPMVAIERGPYQDALATFGASVKPSAIVVISAHWDTHGTVRITSTDKHSAIYDFGGFPAALYALKYDAPGAPELAIRIAKLLAAKSISAVLDGSRGLDHGAWVPLHLMFPKADVPVVEISIPTSYAPEKLFEIGQMLAPFRAEGVLLMGSGGIVHNLRTVDFANHDGAAEKWAEEFDQWFSAALERKDYATLFAYESAPHAAAAVPTPEHFVPVFVAMGAGEGAETLTTLYEGFEYGTISMRSFALR